MFESNSEIEDAVSQLTTLSNGYERGQIIPWSDIEAISGSRFDGRAKYVIQKWRRNIQRDREIVTLFARDEGLRLLTHQETAEEIPELRQRKAYRQVRRALKETSTVEVGRLTDHQRKMLALQRSNMASTRRELFRHRKQARKQQTATETNPRRKQFT